MPIVRCPNCDEAMDVDARELGTTIDCEACDHAFRAKRSRQDEVDEDADERPPRRRSKMSDQRDSEKKTNRTLLIVLLILGVVLGLPCLGCVGFIIYTNTAKVGFTAPWVDQSLNAQDGTIIATASFPANPITQSWSDANGNGTGEMISYSHMVQADSLSDAVTAVAYIDYPDVLPSPLDEVYLPIRKQFAEMYIDTPLSNGTISNETRLTNMPYPTKEARYSNEDGAYVIRVIHVNDRSVKKGTRLVVIVAGGVGLKDTDRENFLQSVRIGNKK